MNILKRIFINLMPFLILANACTPSLTPVPYKIPTETKTRSAPTLTAQPATPEKITAAFDTAIAMQPGINLGNALEANFEGEGGVIIQEKYFDLIKEAGFKSVRIPIRWSAHADEEAPYKILSSFFARVDEVVQWGLERDLYIIINIHNYTALMSDPIGQSPKYLALWQQIAEHYKNYSPKLLFELLNEPYNQLNAPLWNNLSHQVLTQVRQSNPTRIAIIGPVYWNNPSWISTLDLPAEDKYIIATFHYYQPKQFTHQGAGWEPGAMDWVGTLWTGTESEKQAITNTFDSMATWSKVNDRPVLLGEFGTYYKADINSRVRWTEFVAREAEARGFTWTYWEFCSGFGIYDTEKKEFLEPILKALIP